LPRNLTPNTPTPTTTLLFSEKKRCFPPWHKSVSSPIWTKCNVILSRVLPSSPSNNCAIPPFASLFFLFFLTHFFCSFCVVRKILEFGKFSWRGQRAVCLRVEYSNWR
jgi:hypothetical protein